MFTWPTSSFNHGQVLSHFVTYAYKIINLSLATGEMLEDLKCAMHRPLLKKPTADHKVFANFRPVSNLKYISKLIEKAVDGQLNDHLARNDLHVPFQSAYRSCHSTERELKAR